MEVALFAYETFPVHCTRVVEFISSVSHDLEVESRIISELFQCSGRMVLYLGPLRTLRLTRLILHRNHLVLLWNVHLESAFREPCSFLSHSLFFMDFLLDLSENF